MEILGQQHVDIIKNIGISSIGCDFLQISTVLRTPMNAERVEDPDCIAIGAHLLQCS